MTATEEAMNTAQLAAEAADAKQGRSIVAFDVSEHLAITDIFLVVSASNERAVGAIVDAIEEKLLTVGLKPVRREGDRENRWVLLDYLDVVVHVQHDEEREIYSLERLWRDAPAIALDLPDHSADDAADEAGGPEYTV
ncbi:ribosome silencing factor [Propionibacteriaceae bacterium G1746]